MTNCKVTPADFLPILKKLVQADPQRYTNFDNVAKAVITNGSLTPFNKATAIYSFAELFQALHGLDVSFYELGKANNIVGLKSLIESNPDNFIDQASEIFGVKSKVSTIKPEKIIDSIKNLESLKSITQVQIDNILKDVNAFLSSNDYKNQDDRLQDINKFMDFLENTIKQLSPENQTFLLNRTTAARTKLIGKSPYIRLQNLSEDLQTYIVSLPGFIVVEAVKQDGQFISLSGEVITDYLFARPALPTPSETFNRGETIFYDVNMRSGLRIRDIILEGQKPASEVLASKSKEAVNSAFKVFAVKVGNIADNRISRIYSEASSNPSLAGLANRTYETFENEAQIQKLEKSVGFTEVLTVARPKQDQGFILVGVVEGTGETFEIFTLNNYSFVDNNNNTTIVDFSNAEHLKRIQNTSVTNRNGQYAKLTDADINELKKAYEIYKQFENQVLPEVELGGAVTDVTNIFKNSYNLFSYGAGSGTSSQSLDDYVMNNPETAPTVDVVTLDERTGIETNRKTIQVPLVLFTNTNRSTIQVNPEDFNIDSTNWSFESQLGNKEIIEFNGKAYSSVSEFAVDYLGKNSLGRWINAMNSRSIPYNKKYLLTKTGSGLVTSNPIASTMFNNAKFIGLYARIASHFDVVAEALATAEGLSDEQINDLNFEFNTKQIQIDPRGSVAVNINVRKSNENKPILVFTLKPMQRVYGGLIKPISIEFPIDTIKDDIKRFKSNSVLEKLKGKYTSLNIHDLSTPEGIIDLYADLAKLQERHPEDAELKNYNLRVTQSVQRITKSIVDSMVGTFEDVINAGSDELKSAYEKSGLKKNPFLIIAQTTPGLPGEGPIYSLRVNDVKVGKFNTKFYQVLTAKPSKVAFEAAYQNSTSTKISSTKESGIGSTNTQANPAIQNNGLDIPVEDSILSVEEDFSDNYTEPFSEERLQSEKAWLQENLKSAKLEEKDLSELLEIVEANGTILGMYKDSVIYLNKTIKSGGTIYHEAFHHVFRKLMTSKERSRLFKEVKANTKNSKYFTDEYRKSFAQRRKLTGSKERIDNLIAEEILAEGFKSYMTKTKASKPVGLLAKLFSLLKDIIAFFTKNASTIDKVYGRIATGYYKNASVISNYETGSVAFELAPTRHRIVQKEDGTVKRVSSFLPVEDQKQLAYRLAYEIMNFDPREFAEINPDIKLTLRDKFDLQRKLLAMSDFNIESWIATNPGKNSVIQENWRSRLEDMRAILAHGVLQFNIDGQMMAFLPKAENMTGNPSYDNIDDSGVSQVYDKSVDVLFDQVKSILKHINFGSAVAHKEQEDIVEQDIINQDDFDISEDELGSASDLDSSFFNINPLEGLPREMRRFLSLVKYETEDENGVKYSRMVDGSNIFNLLMKITANAMPEEIIPRIALAGEQYRYDENIEEARSLEAVFNVLQKNIRFNESFEPIGGDLLLYSQVIDTFHNAEMDSLLTKLNTKEEYDDQNQLISSQTSTSQVEKLTRADVQSKMDGLESKLKSTNTKSASTEEYKQAAETLSNLALSIYQNTGRITDLIVSNQEVKIESLVDSLYKNMQILGINIPKSLLRFSLLSIDVKENGVLPRQEENVFRHYYAFESFAHSDEYLPKNFFKNLSDMAKNMSKGVRFNTIQGQKLDILSSSRTSGNDGFYASLRRAMKYVLKMDPKELPSVVTNAEGKPVYRYVKYTPAVLLLQEIKNKGLEEALASSIYYSEYLKPWFEDNIFVASALKDSAEGDKKTVERRLALKTFFENLSVSVNAGLEQTVNGQRVRSANYKGLNARSQYLQELMNFSQRSVLKSEHQMLTANDERVSLTGEVTVFNRNLTQLEASQTNFLINAMYINFAPKIVAGKVAFENTPVQYLRVAVQQEFNRIQREWSARSLRDSLYEQGNNTYLNNFNAKKTPTGEIITDDTSLAQSKKLRAYQFNNLDDFFVTGKSVSEFEEGTVQFERATLRDELIEIAKRDGEDKIDFKNLDSDLKSRLDKQLSLYAEESFKKYVDNLVLNDIIKRDDRGVINLKGGSRPREIRNGVINNLDANQTKGSARGTAFQSVYFSNKDLGINGDEQFLRDYYFNYLINGLFVNQIIDGDRAMGIKNTIDYFKRNKSLLAAGSTMKRGWYNVAHVDDIMLLLNRNNILAGQYDSIDDIEDDTIRSEFQALVGEDGVIKEENGKEKVFDGQSLTLLMHRIDFYQETGRLPEKARNLLIESNYRRLTNKEISYLEDNRIVLNSFKTVHAGRENYFKQSEHIINRNDVSVLNITNEQDQAILENAYRTIYDLRQKARLIEPGNTEHELIQNQIKDLYSTIHGFWLPRPHRQKLHDLLNAMEYHQIDMLMDTTASKKVTSLPVSMDERDGNYISLNRSSYRVDARFKFNQVETSGVSDESKASVQAKILLPADIQNTIDRMLAESAPEDRERVTSETQQLANILSRYNTTLARSTNSRLQFMLKALRDENGNINIGELVDTIREALVDQGADSNMLKFFETQDGKPKFNVNLPVIRKTFQYYFFSHYSNKVFDEKVKGGKYFHATSFGYKLLYDKQTGRVIDSVEQGMVESAGQYEQYLDSDRFGTRYPGISTEVDAEGNTTYFVEVIVPMPEFKSFEEYQLFKDKMTKAFATRIPTEDKRSMIAFKIVDFIDASYKNTIIAPQLVHLLAGSDLDIDSLYAHGYASYEDAVGKKHVYGDYSGYDGVSRNDAQFLELINSVGSNSVFRYEIKKAHRELMQEFYEARKDNEIAYDEDTDRVMQLMGLPTMPELAELWGAENIQEEVFKEYMTVRNTNEANEEQANWKLQGELSTKLRAAKGRTDLLESQFSELDKKAYVKLYNYINAVQLVLATNGLPYTTEQFRENPQITVETYQNQNLDAKLGIISNKIVFDSLYSEERSDPSMFKDLAINILGLSPEAIAAKYNAFSIDGVINVNRLNAVNKDGIGITANFNKFLALVGANKLVLKPEERIWFLTDNSGNSKFYDSFGGNESYRSIQLVGNALGMFADGAKDPIPALLQLNDVNLNVTLAMIGLGLPIEMAVFTNMLPEIIDAADSVKDSEINGTYIKMFYKEVNTQKRKLLTDQVSKDLSAAKILSASRRNLIYGNVSVKFTPPTQIDNSRLDAKLLTPAELGYTITAKSGEPLSLEAQKYILLDMYSRQAAQSFGIMDAGRIVNLFKRIKPSAAMLDRFSKSISRLKNNSGIFQNSSELFKGESVWNPLAAAVSDMNTQLSRVMLSRSNPLTSLRNLFGNIFQEQEEMADVIIGTLILDKMRVEAENPGINNDDQFLKNTLKEMFRPEFWFGSVSDTSKFTTLEEDLEYLNDQYSSNPFVRSISIRSKEDAGAARSYYILQMNTKAKLVPELKEEIIDGFNALLKSVDPRARKIAVKLFFHEIIRNGMGRKASNFAQYINTDLYKNLNAYTEELISAISSKSKFEQFFNGKRQIKDVMFQLYVKMLDAAATSKNSKIPTVNAVFIQDIEMAKKIFGVESIKANKKGFAYSDNIIKDLGSGKYVISLDMRSYEGENRNLMNAQVAPLGVRMEDMITNRYEFPAMIKNANSGEIFVLTKLRTSEKSEMTTMSELLSQSIESAGAVLGVQAEYQLYQPTVIDGISLAGFSRKEINDFISYASDPNKSLPESVTPQVSDLDIASKELTDKTNNGEIETKC